MTTTDHTKTLTYLGAALAVFIAVWNLGAYAHGVLSKAQTMASRVVNLEKAVYGVQHECECAHDVEPRITISDPIEFPTGSIVAASGPHPDVPEAATSISAAPIPYEEADQILCSAPNPQDSIAVEPTASIPNMQLDY